MRRCGLVPAIGVLAVQQIMASGGGSFQFALAFVAAGVQLGTTRSTTWPIGQLKAPQLAHHLLGGGNQLAPGSGAGLHHPAMLVGQLVPRPTWWWMSSLYPASASGGLAQADFLG